MSISPECERLRAAWVASIDGATHRHAATEHPHLSTCASCEQWLRDLETTAARFRGLQYRSTPLDLWPDVERRIRGSEPSALPRWLWPIGALVLGWRTLELFVDLPVPLLHPLVPLAAAVAAVWFVSRDPFAIETSAPELQKRGI